MVRKDRKLEYICKRLNRKVVYISTYLYKRLLVDKSAAERSTKYYYLSNKRSVIEVTITHASTRYHVQSIRSLQIDKDASSYSAFLRKEGERGFKES